MIARLILASTLLIATAAPSLADSVTGTIIAFDRKANIIVLDDKTVYTLEGSDAAIPEDLKAGDKIELDFEGEGEDGISKIDAIKRQG